MTLVAAIFGGPVGEVIGQILAFLFAAEGAEFIAAALLSLASAAATGVSAQNAKTLIVVPTLGPIPTGVLAVPVLYGGRAIEKGGGNSQTLCKGI
jgi:hypothetical protein